jgi:hypothetical protein
LNLLAFSIIISGIKNLVILLKNELIILEREVSLPVLSSVSCDHSTIVSSLQHLVAAYNDYLFVAVKFPLLSGSAVSSLDHCLAANAVQVLASSL